MRKNLSSTFDRFFALRSQLDTKHRVDFYAPTYCQSATFVRPLFAFEIFFFTTNNQKKYPISPQMRFLAAIVSLQLSYRCRHRRLLKNCARLRRTTHDYAQLSTMVDLLKSLSIQLVVMVVGVSYSRVVLARRPTGCCSASTQCSYQFAVSIHKHWCSSPILYINS